MEKNLDPVSRLEYIGSGIRDKHPGSGVQQFSDHTRFGILRPFILIIVPVNFSVFLFYHVLEKSGRKGILIMNSPSVPKSSANIFCTCLRRFLVSVPSFIGGFHYDFMRRIATEGVYRTIMIKLKRT
jgi:hypothetical protein